ncbi:30S ribosomal protein S5 [Ferroplasma acidiphilum]|uniref:Small ribosomal subunit protein uS5 n=1 Tax=Ferroplasma acidiphilum TaxID=74969 RepID=A0A7K4FMS9_9ARCH|nr:30S ribosomal protein S5 [Ferroplasma acidiphilum]NOL59668.1 30S ribosomal protein S5 [Ferroplasma acidiphilum]
MDEEWIPKTELGRLVANNEIQSIGDALHTKLPLQEYQIVDYLIPDLQDEVINIERAQRMTDSGRRMNYSITAVVGNGNGYVGIGRGKAKEAATAIRKAINNAKTNIIEIKRGCGSWECGCGRPHSLPFEIIGKSGSVVVKLKSAPQGVGLAVGDVVKIILKMAGIEDAWGFASGHTKTTVNYALATFDALKKTVSMKMNSQINLTTPIYVGGIEHDSNNKD